MKTDRPMFISFVRQLGDNSPPPEITPTENTHGYNPPPWLVSFMVRNMG